MPHAVRATRPARRRPDRACRSAGISYLDGGAPVDATFRAGPGLGVRRTVLHAALLRRGRRRPGCGSSHGTSVRSPRTPTSVRASNGFSARYLAAADGLHSPVRAALGPATGPARGPRRWGIRRHFDVAPWTDCVRGALGARRRGVRDAGRRRLRRHRDPQLDAQGRFDEHLAAFPALRDRVDGHRARARPGRGSAAAEGRAPGGGPGAAGRRRGRLRRRADRRGTRARVRGGPRSGRQRGRRPAGRLRTALAAGAPGATG